MDTVIQSKAIEPGAKTDVIASTTTSQLVASTLAELGVPFVFGIPGGTIAPIVDALIDFPSVERITTRHENTAVFAAAGFARTTGRMAAVLVTSGPGILNALTGIASAHVDGLPVLIIVGEVARNRYGRGALQDGSAQGLNIAAVTSSISKHTIEIPTGESCAPLLHYAARLATQGRRGPVVVRIPMDILSQQVEPTHIDFEQIAPIVPSAGQALPTQLVRAFDKNQRGVLLVGSGARSARAATAVLKLAECLQWPVMTTPKGKGVFPHQHPLSLGVYGIGGHPSAAAYVGKRVDTLVALGTSLGDLSTNSGDSELIPRKALVHVDIHPGHFGRTYPTTFAIQASIENFVTRLLSSTEFADTEPRESKYFSVTHHTEARDVKGDKGHPISPQRAIWEIQQVMPNNTIFAIDSGDHYLFATHYLESNTHDSYIAMSGLGSMGVSVGATIGAKLADRKRPVAAICGDGCLAMVAGDIATAAASGLGIIYFVFNNGTLGMVENGHNSLFGRTPTFSTAPMDIASLAKAFGANSLIVHTHGDIIRQLPKKLASAANKPLLVDIRIDPSITMPQNSRLAALSKVTAGRAGRW